MLNRFLRARVVWLAAGLCAGLAIGAWWPYAPLHATATDRSESFAIATGSADGDTEAIFTLDFLTGDLSGAVVNPNVGQFSALYKRNIMSDLKVEPGKNPKFVMCTGRGELRPRGITQFGASFIYVTEVTTGMMGIYAFPYNPALTNTNRTSAVSAEFIPLQVLPIRNAAVR